MSVTSALGNLSDVPAKLTMSVDMGNADLALGRIEGNDPNADTEPLA